MGRRRVRPGQTRPSRYKGQDGRWHAKITIGRHPDGSAVRKHLSRATRAELEDALKEIERRRDFGQDVASDTDPLLAKWIEHWLSTIAAMSVRWKTLSTYTSLLRRHVIPALGGLTLSELRPEILERHYMAMLDAGHSPYVVHGTHRALRSCLGEAVRRNRMTINPAQVARPPRVPTEEVEPLTADECRAILTAAKSSRQPARWSIALALGLRQGEALGLAWGDIDPESSTIRIRRAVQRQTWRHGCDTSSGHPGCGRARGAECPKRHSGGIRIVETKTRSARRTISLPAPLVKELLRHKRAITEQRLAAGPLWNDQLDLVFPDERGNPVDPGRDRLEWKALLNKAGVRRVRLHDARHTAATLMLVQGVDPRTLMAIMGWTEMATAQRYSHAVDELRQEAARRIGNVLWQSDTPTG